MVRIGILFKIGDFVWSAYTLSAEPSLVKPNYFVCCSFYEEFVVYW